VIKVYRKGNFNIHHLSALVGDAWSDRDPPRNPIEVALPTGRFGQTPVSPLPCHPVLQEYNIVARLSNLDHFNVESEIANAVGAANHGNFNLS
jgi:hypothetical protein